MALPVDGPNDHEAHREQPEQHRRQRRQPSQGRKIDDGRAECHDRDEKTRAEPQTCGRREKARHGRTRDQHQQFQKRESGRLHISARAF